MSTATNGRAREHRIRKHLEDRGWLAIMRAAGSKGAADLLLAHPDHGAALVQVGTAKSKTLGPADRDRFVTAAEMSGALPLLATSGPGIPTRFFVVTRGTASTWTEMAL